jgi:hypothetical protein
MIVALIKGFFISFIARLNTAKLKIFNIIKQIFNYCFL